MTNLDDLTTGDARVVSLQDLVESCAATGEHIITVWVGVTVTDEVECAA